MLFYSFKLNQNENLRTKGKVIKTNLYLIINSPAEWFSRLYKKRFCNFEAGASIKFITLGKATPLNKIYMYIICLPKCVIREFTLKEKKQTVNFINC